VLRAVWDGSKTPPPGAGRDLITHILSRQPRAPVRRETPGPTPHRVSS
jgi:hypothetical protein